MKNNAEFIENYIPKQMDLEVWKHKLQMEIRDIDEQIQQIKINKDVER